MKKQMETGLLSIFLALSSVGGAQAQDHDHDHEHENHRSEKTQEHEFQFTVGKGAIKRYIPIDCDLLGEDGRLTSSFVKQMGVWGHLDRIEERMSPNASDAAKIFAFQQHLKPHGIPKEKIEKAAEYCRTNFPAHD
ncbi:MAG: hypothetical protein ACRBCK_02965 [Alphaproteobacteria bacterium]